MSIAAEPTTSLLGLISSSSNWILLGGLVFGLLAKVAQTLLQSHKDPSMETEAALIKVLDVRTSDTAIQALGRDLAEKVIAAEPPSAPSPVDVDAVVQERVDLAIEGLAERLRGIEDRFPAQDQIDKIASVNDAIMATKIEALQASIERLEERLKDALSKWDVALIVLQVLGAIGALVGLVFGVIKFVSGG